MSRTPFSEQYIMWGTTILLTACASAFDVPQPDTLTVITPVYVDSGFSVEERREIEAGMDSWNYALHGAKFFAFAGIVQHPASREDLPSDAVTVTAETRLPPWVDNPGTVGWVSDIGSSDVHLMQSGCMREVVMHEIGHALGAVHASGLMAPVVTGAACIDGETLRQVAKAQRLNVHTLRETCR